MKMSSKWLLGGLVGVNLAFAGLLAVGQVTASAKIGDQYAVSVELKPTDKKGMVNRVYDTADPTNDAFRQYYSPEQVASKYGRSTSDIKKFKTYFKKYHVSVSAYPGNLFLKVNGTYSNVKKAFKAKVKGSRTVYSLPKSLKSQFSSVIGLTGTYKSLRENLGYELRKKFETTNQKPDLTADAKSFSEKYGALKFINQYHVDKLYDKGMNGNSQHIAIIAGSDFYLKDVQKYLKQNGLSTDVSRIHKYYLGSKKSSQESMINDTDAPAEATLDVDQAASVAPGADIDVYIYPEIDTRMTPETALLHTFNEMIGDDLAKQISASLAYGDELSGIGYQMSESTRQYEAAYDQAFEQASLQGQTVFSASGDSGAYTEVSHRPNVDTMNSPYNGISGWDNVATQRYC